MFFSDDLTDDNVDSHPQSNRFTINDTTIQSDSVNIASCNINGITKKIDDVLHHFSSNQIHVGLLQEWHVHHNSVFAQNPVFPETAFDEYVCKSFTHSTAVLVHKSISTHVNCINLSLKRKSGHYASGIIIRLPSASIACISYYRSHEHSTGNQINQLFDYLHSIRHKYGHDINFIISGDFNVHISDWGSRYNDSLGLLLQECCIDSIPLSCINDGSPTYCNKSTGIEDTLDFTLVSPRVLCYMHHWKSHSYYDKSHWHSDHYFIQWKLSLRPHVVASKRKHRWDFANANWNDFRDRLADDIRDYLQYIDTLDFCHKPNIDIAVETFNTIIINTAFHCIGVVYSKVHHKTLNDNKIDEWRILKKRCLHRLKRLRRKVGCKFRNQIKQLKRQINCLKNRIKRKIKKYKNGLPSKGLIHDINQAISYDNNTNIRIFWRCINRLRNHKRSAVAPLVNNTGRVLTDTAD